MVGVAHAQTPTTLPASSYPSPVISETSPATGAAARTNRDKMGDLLDVRDFNAKCDGTTDDSGAFQAATTAAIARGEGVQFYGHCVVNSQVNAVVNSPAGFSVYGHGGELITHANNLFYVTKSQVAGGPSRFSGFRITNVGAQTGAAITIDGSQNGVGSSQNDRVEDIDFYNTGTAINAIATSNLIVDHINSQIFGSTSAVGIALTGPTVNGTTYYSTNSTVSNWYNVGGQSLMTVSGGVQGVTLSQSRSLDNAGWSVQEVGTGVNFEGVNVVNSYLEGASGGIQIPDAHGIVVHGDSFDTSPQYPYKPSWGAIELGSPAGGGDPVVGNVVSDNSMSPHDQAGMSASLRYYGGQGIITGNVVLGVTGNAVDCMLIDTINLTGSQDNYITLSDNTCWDAGKIDVQGSLASTVQASNDISTVYNGTQYVPSYFDNHDHIAAATVYANAITSNGSGTIQFDQPVNFNFGTQVAFINMKMSALPSSCTVGTQVFVTDGRNTGEAAGAGSGVEAYCTNNQKWFANGSPVQN